MDRGVVSYEATGREGFIMKSYTLWQSVRFALLWAVVLVPCFAGAETRKIATLNIEHLQDEVRLIGERPPVCHAHAERGEHGRHSVRQMTTFGQKRP